MRKHHAEQKKQQTKNQIASSPSIAKYQPAALQYNTFSRMELFPVHFGERKVSRSLYRMGGALKSEYVTFRARNPRKTKKTKQSKHQGQGTTRLFLIGNPRIQRTPQRTTWICCHKGSSPLFTIDLPRIESYAVKGLSVLGFLVGQLLMRCCPAPPSA